MRDSTGAILKGWGSQKRVGRVSEGVVEGRVLALWASRRAVRGIDSQVNCFLGGAEGKSGGY